MPVPGILKSKAFWSFSTVFSGISGAVVYDRYQASILREKFLKEAAEYGRQPLLQSQTPRCLNFFLLSTDSVSHRALRDNFLNYAVHLLTAAGIDYKWIVEVDGEESARKWDEIAREANKPELMLDDASTNKIALIPLEDLKANILKPSIKALLARSYSYFLSQTSDSSADSKENIWVSLRQKFSSFSSPVDSIEIVTFDYFTQDAVNDEIKSFDPVSKSHIANTQPAKNRGWFSGSQKKSPESLQQPIPTTIAALHIPCDYPQTISARLMRFLFGQRELTQNIGEAVMEVIRK